MGKMLFGLCFAPAAVSFLDEFPRGKVRAQIARRARALIDNPYPVGCKKLKGLDLEDEPIWRILSGDYRILYFVRDLEVVILDIGHRKDIYR